MDESFGILQQHPERPGTSLSIYHHSESSLLNRSMVIDATAHSQSTYNDINHQQKQSTLHEQINRDYAVLETTATEGLSSNALSTPIVKLTVPKLKLRVPKEFQKSVDAVLSTSESDEGSDETSGEAVAPMSDDNEVRPPSESTESTHPTNAQVVNGGSGVFFPGNVGTHWKQIFERGLEESTMNKQQHEHQPPGMDDADGSALLFSKSGKIYSGLSTFDLY